VLIPLTELLTVDRWPAQYAPGTMTVEALLSKIYFTDYRGFVSDSGLGFETSIVVAEEISVGLPGLPGISLVVGSASGPGLASYRLEAYADDQGFTVRADDVEFALRFARELLQPVPTSEGAVPPPYVQISVRGAISIDRTLDLRVEGFGRVALAPAMIGNSGVTLAADDVRLDLSRSTTRPEIIAAGFDESFIGAFIGEARLTLPAGVSVLAPESLQLLDAAIGSGGVSGCAEAHYHPTFDTATKTFTGAGAGTLFGIAFGLRELALEFRQNAVIASAIQGELLLPFFDQVVAVDLTLGLDGDFTAALSAVQPIGVARTDAGLIEFEKPGILRVRVDSLELERSGGDLLVRLSGTVKLLYGDFEWPEVQVRELSIDRNGRVRIDGGWLDLPESKVLDFNGFAMELTRIGFGNEGDRRWIGFSGGVRLVDALAFGASVEGLKILWDASGKVDLQMSSIRVELAIRDLLDFTGFLDYFQDGDTKGFRGDIDLTLHPLELSIDASLVVGRNRQAPPYNFFYIFVDANLPSGVPLGQTNLAIYGFAALMGSNMMPGKSAGQDWFQWYLLPPVGTTATEKWADLRDAQALGAGLTLGTASDDGFALAAKAILIALLPGPILLIDGNANILKPRRDLAGAAQGDFRALAVLDKQAGTLLVNVQPRYKCDPVSAALLDIVGAAEGFFDFNRPDAWHVYLGQAEPADERIRARVLKGLLRADSYLMLDQPGMRFGASAGFDEDYRFGPLRVDLKARIDGEAALSWHPVQAEGMLTLEGRAGLRAFGCKSSASVNARIEVQSPRPYYVYGEFRVKLRTPWPLRDPSARVRLEWGNPDEEPLPQESVSAIVAEHLKVKDAWPLARTAEALAPQQVPADLPVIPLDSRILINFTCPVADEALVGCNAAPFPPPEQVGGLEMLHELIEVELSRASESGWSTVERRAEGEGDLYGMWLPLPGESRAAAKLQLWSSTPFTYTRNAGRSYADWFLQHHSSYPCAPEEPAERLCVNFDDVATRVLPALFIVGDLIFEFLFATKDVQPRLVPYESPSTGTRFALLLTDPDAGSLAQRVPLRITLPEPASEVRLDVRVDRPAILRAFRRDQEVASKSVDAGTVQLTIEANRIEYAELELTGPEPRGTIRLLRVCWVAQSDHARANEVERVRSHLKKEMAPETARWCGRAHLLRPDSLYRLTISTRIRTWRDGDEETSAVTKDYAYFRTTPGPPGFFASQGPLRSLTPYVNATGSTPSNGAPSVYRGYDLRLAFNENYVQDMYDGNSRHLTVALRDRNGQPAPDERGAPVSPVTEWLADPYTPAARPDALWRWALEREEMTTAGGCGPAGDLAACVAPNGVLEVRLLTAPLAPQLLVEARVGAAGRDAPVYRFSFTTSRFVTFVHHLQSFEDAAWDRYRLLGEPAASLLTADQLAGIAQIVATRRTADPAFDAVAEGAMFDEAFRVLTAGHGSLPDRVEVAVLRDADRSYALLLESPEPIEWARATLVIHQAPESGSGRSPSSGSVKIIGVALPPATASDASYNSEWIELLVQADTDLSGYAIGYAGGAAGSFMPYYQFATETILPAGTIVRVHAGAQETDATPDARYEHRYATAPGSPEQWRLNAAGDSVRLVDPEGREVQHWSVIPDSLFREVPHIIVRSADQTRALLFLPEPDGNLVADIPAGRLRLEWRFRLDLGPPAVLLKRKARTDPEEAILEFTIPAVRP
jgi:hypothetical protein